MQRCLHSQPSWSVSGLRSGVAYQTASKKSDHLFTLILHVDGTTDWADDVSRMLWIKNSLLLINTWKKCNRKREDTELK